MKAKIRIFCIAKMVWRNLRMWWKGKRQKELNPQPLLQAQSYPHEHCKMEFIAKIRKIDARIRITGATSLTTYYKAPTVSKVIKQFHSYIYQDEKCANPLL